MKIVTITDVCDIQVGKTPSRNNKTYWGEGALWLSIADMNQGSELRKTKETITQKAIQECNCKLIPSGTVLFSFKLSIGKVGINKVPMYTNEAIAAFIIKDDAKLNTKFLYYVLKSVDHNIGSNRAVMGKTLNKKQLEQIKIPLPPLEDQKRIVAVLDQADSLRQKRQKAISLLDDYLKAVFLEMFGDPHNNIHDFSIGTIGDLVCEVKYGTSKKAEEKGEYIYLRMNNITYSGEWDLSALKYINLTDDEKPKYLAEHGDILFNRTNSKELVGKTAVYDLDEPMAIAGYLIRARVNDKAVPEYISGYLNSKHGKLTLEKMCKNIVGMANINAKELQKIRIIIPPVALQEKYAQIVKKNRALKAVMINQSKELNTNFDALMQRSFTK